MFVGMLRAFRQSGCNRSREKVFPMDEFNEPVEKPADEMSTRRSPIIVVDHDSGFDPEIDFYDGIHPNESGES